MTRESEARISNTEAELRSVLGDAVGREFYCLVNELVWVHDKWREYVSLYGTSEPRIALLNQAAERFFGCLDGILWEDILLHLCRLTDRTRAGGYEQLTVRRLPQLFAGTEMEPALKSAVNKATRATKFARDWRDRHIGHRSRDRALNPAARPLSTSSRAHVVKALSAIGNALLVVYKSRLGGGNDFAPPGGPGDAEELLFLLDMGVQAKEARAARIASRQPLPDDFAPRRAL